MALIRWNPLQELADMRRQMDSLSSLMSGSFMVPFMEEERFIPAMDVTTRGDDLVVKLEAPGLDPDKDINISVEGDMLHIAGKRTAEREEEKGGYRVREMRHGSFERSLPLPEGIEPDAISAEYRDGILEVKVAGGAKAIQAPERRQIPVSRVEAKQVEGQSSAGSSSSSSGSGSGGSSGSSS